MTAVVFLAHPITHANEQGVAHALKLRASLIRAGFDVRYGGETVSPTARQTAERNVSAVATSDILVALLPGERANVSSVWVEIGIALALSIPVVIVASTTYPVALPFLVDSLKSDESRMVRLVDEHPIATVVETVLELTQG